MAAGEDERDEKRRRGVPVVGGLGVGAVALGLQRETNGVASRKNGRERHSPPGEDLDTDPTTDVLIERPSA